MWFMLVGSIILILIVELLNTSIEKLGDRISLEHDPKIGEIKDISSAAVGTTLILSLLIWLWSTVRWILS